MLSVREPFAGLFTQGMVTHETYRRQSGEWLEPHEVEVRSEGATRRAYVVATGEPAVIGEAEKMSRIQAQRRRAGRRTMYGVDAARIFVLSDSPERDVPWMAPISALASINRIWAEFDERLGDGGGDAAAGLELRRATHKATRAVTDRRGFQFNSAIARLQVRRGGARPVSPGPAGRTPRNLSGTWPNCWDPLRPRRRPRQALGSGLLALAPCAMGSRAAGDDERILGQESQRQAPRRVRRARRDVDGEGGEALVFKTRRSP